MDMTMFEWPTKAKVESTDYVAICDADGNEKKIAVDDLKNIQKAETTGETVEEWLKTKLKSYAGFRTDSTRIWADGLEERMHSD